MKSYLTFFVFCLMAFSCDSNSKKIEETLQAMQSRPISIPYEQMECWTNDSIASVLSRTQSAFKLVHYLDSVQCTSCYLHKMSVDEELHNLEKQSHGRFLNIFIASPSKNNMKKIIAEYNDSLLPMTLFIDTVKAFKRLNPNIPNEFMYHVFLLDEKNNVIYVGNPLVKKSKEKIINIIKQNIKNE